jgi:hypothetical protein
MGVCGLGKNLNSLFFKFKQLILSTTSGATPIYISSTAATHTVAETIHHAYNGNQHAIDSYTQC